MHPLNLSLIWGILQFKHITFSLGISVSYFCNNFLGNASAMQQELKKVRVDLPKVVSLIRTAISF
jgi:hypothetical protein